MSTQHVRCPTCTTTVLAEHRRGKAGPVSRAADRVTFIADVANRRVIICCPDCGTRFAWKGKRILIIDAA
jgi:endogenous inhibitor of DNA gyrase (YacG/DUF329 family)